jgi:hypothetical protein
MPAQYRACGVKQLLPLSNIDMSTAGAVPAQSMGPRCAYCW